jgi:hypothetical protein
MSKSTVFSHPLYSFSPISYLRDNSRQPGAGASGIVLDWRSSSGGLP